jgi:PAS domain S-box-containing protein
LKGQRRVLELLARRAPLGETLTVLCETIEEQLPRALCSVLLLDAKAGTLHHAAGPRLPEAYREAIDGERIGPRTGSCGTAAFERRAVTVEDIANDPLWVDYRDLALAHSLAACASIPIFDAADDVLGTFAIYQREPGPFSPLALALLRDVSGLATLAIESDRRAAALSESEEKLRMAVDAAGVGLWSWDVRRDLVTWEDPLCAIFGLPRGTAPIGREGYVALVHPDDRERVGAAIARGVAAGSWEDEYRIVRSDGATRWVVARGSVLSREGRDLVLGAVIDVTDRRQRDEQLREAQKLEAVGQLTAGIAHNFNNMLMGLLPNLALAVRAAPAELAPLLRSAEHSAERAADLVRQLMTSAGRSRPRARSVESIGALVERTVALCRRTFDQRIAFEAHYDPHAHASVDPVQLEQAILNLLINARDALDEVAVETGRITSTWTSCAKERRSSRGARAITSDSGSGTTAPGWTPPSSHGCTSRSSRRRRSARGRASASRRPTRSFASTGASSPASLSRTRGRRSRFTWLARPAARPSPRSNGGPCLSPPRPTGRRRFWSWTTRRRSARSSRSCCAPPASTRSPPRRGRRRSGCSRGGSWRPRSRSCSSTSRCRGCRRPSCGGAFVSSPRARA